MQSQSQGTHPAGSNSNKSREQKLEAALQQLIELAAAVRFRQRRFDTEFGSHNKDLKNIANDKLDQVLKTMGVDETTDFKRVKIKFLQELTVEEVEDLSKNLIK